jgi:hypothetical protein
MGQLTYSYWGVGDSEINYTREQIVDANQSIPSLSGASQIMSPFDKQPKIKSYITNNAGDLLNTMNSSNINVIKAVVNNKAEQRGFFTGITSNQFDTKTGTTFMKSFTSISNTSLSGGTTLYIPSGITRNQGDLILLRVKRDTTSVVANSIPNNLTPIPYLWFKIQTNNVNNVILDRTLPNYASQASSTTDVFIYSGGDVSTSFGSGTTTAYWDSGVLAFDAASNVTCSDVPVWNMNNVYSENLAGLTGVSTTKLYEDYTKFGSYSYLGSKYPYYNYPNISTTAATAMLGCNDNGSSYLDDVTKSISILHYTNNTISSFYGEYLYIDTTVNKTVVVNIPDLMYHRSNFSTEQGTQMGMRFIASGNTQYVENSDIQFIDLIEAQSFIGSKVPRVVGRVFPQTKMIVFSDDEIVAAISYKSNRNWTLPALSATLGNASGGTSTGILDVNKTMYLTYSLENNGSTGLTTALPCQTYIKIDNNTSSAKDVLFKISDVDLLPYMHKVEKAFDTGAGFHAYKFKVLYQIVNDSEARPDSSGWSVYDFTSTALTTTVNTTIDPLKLELQNPTTNGFILTSIVGSASTQFDITQSLSMALNTSGGTSTLQFGDERFFYGNIDTYIGATIYKTIFDIRLNSGQFSKTTNPTRSQDLSTNPPNIKVSEVGIFDSESNLVAIGKLSSPVALLVGDSIMLELSIDF